MNAILSFVMLFNKEESIDNSIKDETSREIEMNKDTLFKCPDMKETMAGQENVPVVNFITVWRQPAEHRLYLFFPR